KDAVTVADRAPLRTSLPSPRAPRARLKLSRTIDLPAPVSPVKMVSPLARERSRLSIRTMSRIERATSMASPYAIRVSRAARLKHQPATLETVFFQVWLIHEPLSSRGAVPPD